MFYGHTNKVNLNLREGEERWGSPSLAESLRGSPFKHRSLSNKISTVLYFPRPSALTPTDWKPDVKPR